ncbi:MAG: HEAT repeat domain-containing protein [Myxococcales bacterium]|nr:HEAT repeat domain-containing protein [Myxococcales bacterium]
MKEHCGGLGRAGEARAFAFPSARENYAADRPIRAEHLRLEVALDFEAREVTGTCSTRLRAVREVGSLSFDAVGLEVEWATVDDARVDFTNSGRHLRLQLSRPLSPEESAEVAIRYRCQPSRGLYFFGPDQGYPDRPLQAWTQGQDEDSRCWFPCLDAPAQRATSEVIATFPAEMTALSNGELVSDKVQGGLRTMHFRLGVPHPPYLVTLAVGELEEASDKSGQTRLRYLFPPGRREDALRCVGRTPEMVAAFEELTAQAYPFGTYSQVFVTEFIFGGMENTSATTLTELLLHDERAHRDFTAEDIVSHELAHQWFGDLLTCRDWAHGWLNEGFATYLEVLWREKSQGVDEADQHRRDCLRFYLEESGQRYVRPIVTRRFDEPIDLFDRHLYDKGALVLHELRRRLGDPLFFKALRRYVELHRGRSVETVDFARTVEETTGRNLDGFFDQYVFAPGHPELKAEVRFEPEEKRVRLRVRQTQKTAEGGWPIFRLPIDVQLWEGRRSTAHHLELVDQDQVFYLPASREPTQLLVDPRRDVLGTLEVDKPLSCWLEELKEAPYALSRSEAAMALARDGSSRAVEALATSLAKDGFWATQAACAKALGKVRTPAAKRALLSHLSLSHPKARRAVMAALGEFKRDEEVAKSLSEVCRRGDESGFVEGEAARSLGKVRAKSALGLLEEVSRRRSFQDAVAAGAIDGMAETMEPEAFARLEPMTRYGQPPYVRRAAVLALGKLAEPAQKKREALEALKELLRDAQLRVQLAAVDAAEALGDRRMVEALESTPFSDGRTRRAAREAARALCEGEPQRKELSALREELDKLKEETRALKERLEGLSTPKAARARKPPAAKRRAVSGRASRRPR